MQLHQLEYLVAVVDEGGFSRAAPRLRVAQPGVSAQVRKLERELGQTLLDRSGPRVRPTDVGSAVLGPARAALAAVVDVRHVVEALSGLLRGRVRVGAVGSGIHLGVPDALADFAQAHPGVEVTLTEAGSADLVLAVREGRLDLALVGVTGEPPAGLVHEPVVEETLVVAVRPDDPFARRTSVAISALGRRDLVAPPRGNALRDALDLLLAGGGERGPVRITFEVADPATVAHLVARGVGIAVLPASVGALSDGTLVGVPPAGPGVPTGLGLVRRADAAPATDALAHAVVETITGRASPGRGIANSGSILGAS